jgi:hypothetical protein
VRCYACGITHWKWTSRDGPIAIHRSLTPSCFHVINLYSTDEHSYSASANSRQLIISSANSAYYQPNNTLTTSVPRTDSAIYSNNLSHGNALLQYLTIKDTIQHVLDRNNTQTDTTTNCLFRKKWSTHWE